MLNLIYIIEYFLLNFFLITQKYEQIIYISNWFFFLRFKCLIWMQQCKAVWYFAL